MKKLNLSALKVNSFITLIDNDLANTAKGGITEMICTNGCTDMGFCQPKSHDLRCSVIACP